MSKRTADAELPDWERLLSAAARLQEIVPGAVLVGGTAAALRGFDVLYPQSNGESSLQQLYAQLASPLPYDLEQTNLSEYRHLESRWHDWNDVASACRQIAVNAFDRICGEGGET